MASVRYSGALGPYYLEECQVTTHDELIEQLRGAPEQVQVTVLATILAMRLDPDAASLRALMEVSPPDPTALAGWLRAHEWLDVDPVCKLGRASRIMLAWEARQRARDEHARQVAKALHVDALSEHLN